MTPFPAESAGEWFNLRSRAWTDFPDSWNPMLIREIRRMLKGRAFAITFLLLLLSCWATSFFLVMTADLSLDLVGAGRQFCSYFFVILLLPNCFVVPLSLFALAAEEHSEQTLEVLTLSTLRIGQIFSGFFWCGALHAGIYYAAVVPFICFSYLLRGVALPNILVALVVSLLFTTYMMACGMMLGACSSGPIRRTFCVLLLVGMGAIAFSVSSTMVTVLISMTSFPDMLGFALPSLVCTGSILVTILLFITGFGVQQFRLFDPLVSPYNVRLDENGNVKRFDFRFGGIQVELEQSLRREYLPDPPPPTAGSRAPS
ncbi:hypothetical protein [Rubinisphaera margarita]|uniref:hypothetical protein n=1 Tax=Rubinisphaera margarita TaxID=2909586 RepID=UPI001EE8CCE1|nr:hypothetical protein [Rubinisphaera margarita]MCG6156920.1 hypothetical protein [Rubinisphaera margarita]